MRIFKLIKESRVLKYIKVYLVLLLNNRCIYSRNCFNYSECTNKHSSSYDSICYGLCFTNCRGKDKCKKTKQDLMYKYGLIEEKKDESSN